MRGLTKAQVLAFIQARMQRTGPGPSYREIAAHLGVTVPAADQHVRALACKEVLSTPIVSGASV